MSVQPLVNTLSIYVSYISHNLRANSVIGQHFILFTPIYPTQAQINMELTVERPFNDRSTSPMYHDKSVAIKERLRAIEGNNLTELVLTTEVCLVPNIVVSKEFRVLDFVKYSGLECLNTHLQSYYNKIAEMIHNDKVLIYFFQDSLTRFVLSWYMRLDNTKIKK